MKINKDILKSGGNIFFSASAVLGLARILKELVNLSKKDPEVIKKFFKVLRGVSALFASVVTFVILLKKFADSLNYKSNRMADGDLYTIERMADAMVKRTRNENPVTDFDPIDDENTLEESTQDEHRISWIEKFKSMFTMPALPPFLTKMIGNVPTGYKEPMLLHLLSMLGALCFSKVRAKYSDDILHAPNLQVIIEGNWGSGKGKFEQIYKELFYRVLGRSYTKIEQISDEGCEDQGILQTTGIGTSMPRFVDILANNQGCHMYMFNSEISALFNDLRRGNGINFDFLRKAFENGDICRNNKAKNSKNGIFPIYLNYTFTGTPVDINSTFSKELEGGTLSRIAWACIPETGETPDKLHLPEGKELENIRDMIDDWISLYCFRSDPDNGDSAVEELVLDLDYVCKELEMWNQTQYNQSKTENNPARRDVRLRIATIAFHCAMVIHMLYDNPAPTSQQKRKQVVDLTIYIADYCMERFLHKFGKSQNEQRKANLEAELVKPEAEKMSDSEEKITDVAELKRLHDIKEKGKNSYGWDKLAKLSGWSRSDVRRKVKAYEKELGQQ